MVLRTVLLLADKNYTFTGLRIIFRGVAYLFFGLQANNAITEINQSLPWFWPERASKERQIFTARSKDWNSQTVSSFEVTNVIHWHTVKQRQRLPTAVGFTLSSFRSGLGSSKSRQHYSLDKSLSSGYSNFWWLVIYPVDSTIQRLNNPGLQNV